ncbi:TPA: hypothetical protein N0F65_003633 [Lagenidium giganteum]|uniref:Uncharacterized protein n=1 Tax=Lagenidium giganteum TaxID=4803 RepID=A0AAV2YP01_9STRA|nr:TPA: hypothetical protein N0F65_003633 [Lagenidium giganteum]
MLWIDDCEEPLVRSKATEARRVTAFQGTRAWPQAHTQTQSNRHSTGQSSRKVMGMACDTEARRGELEMARDSGATGSAVAANNDCGEVVNKRSRSKSEETALILTSLSMGKFGAEVLSSGEEDEEARRHGSDMEDISGDEHEPLDPQAANVDPRKQQVQQIHFDGPSGRKLDFTDDSGINHRFRNESNRVKSLVTKHISIDELREHFDRPIIDVAKDFGICITLMKKICRRNGIKRWPHRQIRSLSKSIASMEAAMLSAQGSEREKYRDQIMNLKMKRESVIADPNKENGTRPKTPTKDYTGEPRVFQVPPVKISPRAASEPFPTVKAEPEHHELGHYAGGAAASLAGQNVATVPGHGHVAVGGSGNNHMASSNSNNSNNNNSQSNASHSKGGRWTSEEHSAFLEGIRLYGKDWRRVAQVVMTRSAVQTRTHAQKYLLKFAGRFPFDGDAHSSAKDDAPNDQHHHAPHDNQTNESALKTEPAAPVDAASQEDTRRVLALAVSSPAFTPATMEATSAEPARAANAIAAQHTVVVEPATATATTTADCSMDAAPAPESVAQPQDPCVDTGKTELRVGVSIGAALIGELAPTQDVEMPQA